MQNNNESMATVVETFLVEETKELMYDNDKLEQWNGLVGELGLTGQTKIVAPEKSPIPYLHMKQQLINAFDVLCPVRVDVKEYDKQPIPVEILSLVAMSIKENHFDFIQIWYDDKTPDPVCVGLKKTSNWDDEHVWWSLKSAVTMYLIGRWGDVKMSLDAVVNKAKALYKMQRELEYKKQIKDATRALDDLEAEVENHLGFAMPTTQLPF